MSRLQTYFLLLMPLVAPDLDAIDRFPFFEPVQPPRPVQVIAHRGESRQAPENTRSALQRCMDDGVEWAEVDLRLTRDGHHVLAHGERLPVGEGTGPDIAASSLEDLRKLDLGTPFAVRYAGEQVLTLPECLQLARGKLNLYLDCKAVNAEQLAREILAAGLENQVVVYGEPALLQRVRAAGSGRIPLMAKWRPGRDIPAWVATHHLAAVEINADEINRETVAAFHGLGVRVQSKNLDAWDRPEFWDRALEAGADWIQTDLPEEVLAHGLWKRVRERPVRFSLHRGANRYAPENTLPAFHKAIRLGADLVEFDVRTTRDGKFYLLHDRTLDGKTDGHGPIREWTADAVSRVSAGVKFGRAYASVGLPTLDEFLGAVAGKIDLYFDAKDITPEALAEAVARHGMTERTIVYQSPEYLLRLRALAPGIRALPPLGNPAELDDLARRLKPYAVDADWSILSADLIARCHALGIRVFSDALGAHEKVEDYLRAIDWGIDVIQTDHPLRVMRAIELRSESRR